MKILFSDMFVAVCVKDVGLSSQDGADSVPERIKGALGGDCYTVHRLDLNVGGVMVYARTKKAAAELSKAIQENKLKKEYLAVVNGKVEPSEGEMCDLLLKDSRQNKVFTVKRERKGVKKARLTYETIDSKNDKSLVHVILDTGRSHQIRVQFASRKHPLLGDHKYGSRDKLKEPALWSYRLTFPHPITHKDMTFSYLPDAPVFQEFTLPNE